jgi:hypothetical protein
LWDSPGGRRHLKESYMGAASTTANTRNDRLTHAINALNTPARVQTTVRDDPAQGAMTQPRLQLLRQTLMRRLQTLVNCIDNSGAAIVECVNVLRSKRPAKVGKSGQFARGCWG